MVEHKSNGLLEEKECYAIVCLDPAVNDEISGFIDKWGNKVKNRLSNIFNFTGDFVVVSNKFPEKLNELMPTKLDDKTYDLRKLTLPERLEVRFRGKKLPTIYCELD